MIATPPWTKRNAILLVVFSALGILGLLGRGGYVVIAGIISFNPASSTAADDLASPVLDAISMIFCTLLLIPTIYYNIRRLKNKGVREGVIPAVKIWHLVVVAAVWFFIVLSGSLLAGSFRYGWVVAAPLFPFGLALPVAGLAWIAAGGLPAGSRLRLWSVFGMGMVGSTFLAVIAEYLVVGVGLIVLGVLVLAHPELRSVLAHLKNQLNNVSDLQSAVTILAPYLENPLILGTITLFFAGIGPMIEEAVKPLAIWFLGKRLRSPSEGFALGALCGAGFALLEGLLAASGSPNMWAVGMAGRAVSSLMHITASGIMGWGIASVRLEKHYVRLVGAYLAAVLIHGSWNGSIILMVFGSLQISLSKNTPGLVSALAVVTGLGVLLLLFGLMLVLLPVINQILRPRAPVQLKAPGQYDV